MTIEATGVDLHVRRGGLRNGSTLLLIHGAGANGDVWTPLMPSLARWPGAWVIPDLRGHGRSGHRGPYGFGVYAADLAALFEAGERIFVLGHSLGGAIGWMLATNHFGVEVERVLSFDVKIDWTPDEVAKARALAQAPVRWFDTREEAAERYLKVSGQFGFAALSSDQALSGIVEEEGRYRLRVDPKTYAATGAPSEPLLRAAQAPIHMATGANDPMLSEARMRSMDPAGRVFAGCGHNGHVERPDLVWDWVESVIR